MKIKGILLALLIVAGTANLLFTLDDPLLTLPSKFQTDLLFVQQASSATLKKDPTIPGQYQLSLRGLYPRIVYISAESRHKAGVVPLRAFLKSWQSYEILFKDQGPSPILSHLSFKLSIQSGIETDVLELSKPVYHRPSNSLLFTVKTVPDQPIKIGRFKNVVLVYDGINLPSDQLKSEYKVMPTPLSAREVTHNASQ